MSIKVAQNFDYKGQLPNFERDSFTTLIELRDSNPDWFDDGHISYCKETESHYVFNRSNAFNDKTGYFRILKTESSGSSGSGTGIGGSIFQGDEAPEDTNLLWLDTSTEYTSSEDVATIESLQEAVRVLSTEVDSIKLLRTNGVVAGTVSDSVRVYLANSEDPERPQTGLDDILNESSTPTPDYSDLEEVKPEYEDCEEPNVPHISIKMGTYSQLQAYIKNFIPGELLWCTNKKKLYIYINGSLVLVAGSTTADDDEDNTGGSTDMDTQEILTLINNQLQQVESIGFIPVGSTEPKYTVKVSKEGTLLCYDKTLDSWQPVPSQNYYFSDSVSHSGLLINSFYLGGDDDEHSYNPCSHNYIELSNVWMIENAEQKDINLNGFYLLYNNGQTWESLPLWGTIKANSTFVIRGAQCSVMDANTTVIKVKNYDMVWEVEKAVGTEITHEPIKFNRDSAVFYLVWSDPNNPGKIFTMDSAETSIPVSELSTNTNKLINTTTGECAKGYIDLASFRNQNICENTTYDLPRGVNAGEVLFRRWYPMDPVCQSNPDDGLKYHNNIKYLTSTYLNGSNWDDKIPLEEWTPKASWEGKSMSETRSLFLEDKPNTLTITFGIQATDNSEEGGNGASRGFCWNSVGYYDEYLLIRKVGSETWEKVESIKDTTIYTADNSGSDLFVWPACLIADEEGFSYVNYYSRQRWESSYGQVMTTHKVLLAGLKAGNYEYKVVRDYKDDISEYLYQSKTRNFKVHKNSEVKDFSYVQTTDQQGVTWEEFETWVLTARMMKRQYGKTIPNDYRFVINTGDVCYNGSRSNEWLDYFYGQEPLDDREEMLTIGNNDLIPPTMREIGTGQETPWKINPAVIDYFYCIEMNINNPTIFVGKSAKDESLVTTHKIPGLYSFNYGDFHFISLLSEIRTGKNKSTSASALGKNSTVEGIWGVKDELRSENNTQASKIFDTVEGWISRDLMLWKGCTADYIKEKYGKDLEFDWELARFDENILNRCNKCIVFTHEMPFNITSSSSYNNYSAGNAVPRETAKAYLNRYHNFEFQRVFKLWGIPMVMGGHKHTCAITQPVYDAPIDYNPITKKINEREYIAEDGSLVDVGHYLDYREDYKEEWNGLDQILNDNIIEGYTKEVDGENKTYYTLNTNGSFSHPASFRPFIQITPDEIANAGGIFDNTNEVYNNSSIDVTIKEQVISTKSWNDKFNTLPYPRCRVEIVDKPETPSYIMCQTSGFKNKSNSDLACNSVDGTIPWERFYVPGDQIAPQCAPYYTVYNIVTSDGNPRIEVNMYRVSGMYADNGGGNGGSPDGYWSLANIYTHGDTLEENRNYFTGVGDVDGALEIRLFNEGGTTIKI